MRRVCPSLICLTALALVVGCDDGDPFAYRQVSGKVLYDDGSTIRAARIEISFVPQTEAADEKTHPRPGIGNVNKADGTFNRITSHKPADGIVAGRHKVVLRSFDEMENETDHIPPEYRDPTTTPLEVDTATGTTFDLTVKKPE